MVSKGEDNFTRHSSEIQVKKESSSDINDFMQKKLEKKKYL
jgi:hypothetical protein